nr:MAG TPA: hypothetical protein [Bacteriophage sp.]
MYLSLLGNLSLRSVIQTRVAYAKWDMMNKEDIS